MEQIHVCVYVFETGSKDNAYVTFFFVKADAIEI